MKKQTTVLIKGAVVMSLFVLSGVLGHLKISNPFLKTLFEWTGYSVITALLAEWGVRVYTGFTNSEARKNMLAVVGLLLFWHLIKIVKWGFVTDNTATRYLWYLFYVPMILLPLFFLFVSLCVGKSDNYKIPKGLNILFLPAALLIAAVMFNDYHRLAFTFDDIELANRYYSYGVLYYVIAVRMCALTVVSLAVLYKRCKIPKSRKRVMLPFLIVLITVAYCAGYSVLSETYIYKCLDVTTVFCAVVYGIFNCCSAVGLINTNFGYAKLFEQSNINAIITDEFFNEIYISGGADKFDKKFLRQAVAKPIELDGNKILRSIKIAGGYCFFAEDISEINRLLEILKDNGELLRGKEEILKAEIAVKKKRATVEKQLELFAKINEATKPQIEKTKKVLEEILQGDSGEKLKIACFFCAYVKRLSNFLLLLENETTAKIRELSLAIRETLNFATLFGAECDISADDNGVACLYSLIKAYSLFEEYLEPIAENLDAVYVKLSQTPSEIILNIFADRKDGNTDFKRIVCKKGGERL